MSPYIVNLTNNLIGTYRFDVAYQAAVTTNHAGWKEDFIRFIQMILLNRSLPGMSSEKLGEIVCCIDGNEIPCENPAMYFGNPKQFLQNIVAFFLSWSIFYRLDEQSRKLHRDIPAYGEYRKLTISHVQIRDGMTQLTFHESVVGFDLKDSWLREHGVDPTSLVVGREVLIKGRLGNDDVLLTSPRALVNIKLA